MGDFRRPPITVLDLASCTLQKRVTIKLWKSKPMRIVSVTRPDIHWAADLHQRLALYRIRNKRIYYTAPTSSENHCQEKPISEDYILWVRCSVCELWLALIADKCYAKVVCRLIALSQNLKLVKFQKGRQESTDGRYDHYETLLLYTQVQEYVK